MQREIPTFDNNVSEPRPMPPMFPRPEYLDTAKAYAEARDAASDGGHDFGPWETLSDGDWADAYAERTCRRCLHRCYVAGVETEGTPGKVVGGDAGLYSCDVCRGEWTPDL